MVTIKIYSHALHVSWDTAVERQAVRAFCGTLVEYETVPDPRTKEKIKRPIRTYASADPSFTGLGLLRTDLVSFLSHLSFYGITDIDKITMPDNLGEPIDVNLKDGWVPREAQQEAVNFITEGDYRDYILDCDTGFGKTFLGYYAVAHYKVRTAFVMKATHLITWSKTIFDILDVAPDRVILVEGMAAIRNLIEMRRMGMQMHDVLFISANTMGMYVTAYERGELDDFYPAPVDFYSFLGIGMVERDEVHELPHATVKQYAHLHVKRVIGMSATIHDEDAFKMTQYRRFLPKERTYVGPRNKHATIAAMRYSQDGNFVTKHKGLFGYNHVSYEKWIMAKPARLASYLAIITETLEGTYFKDYRPGMKLMVLAGKVEMCDKIKEAVEKLAHPKGLSVTSYTQKTNAVELYKNDAVVTTVGSGGTGKDIPNLSHTLMTVAIGKMSTYRQVLGRGRPVKLYPDFSPFFMHLMNTEIEKHVDYDKRRAKDQKGKCKEYIYRDLTSKLVEGKAKKRK